MDLAYPPKSLVFTRKSGKSYLHFGREVNEQGEIKDFVKSLETGKSVTMSQMELENFRNG